jgi:hypothetical protein
MTHYRGASATTTTRPPTSKEEIGRGSALAPAQTTSTGRFTTTTPPHCRTPPPATTAGQRRSNDETAERRRKHQLLIQHTVALGSSTAPAIGAGNGDQEHRSDVGARSNHRVDGKQQGRTKAKLPIYSRSVTSAISGKPWPPARLGIYPAGKGLGYCSRELAGGLLQPFFHP